MKETRTYPEEKDNSLLWLILFFVGVVVVILVYNFSKPVDVSAHCSVDLKYGLNPSNASQHCWTEELPYDFPYDFNGVNNENCPLPTHIDCSVTGPLQQLMLSTITHSSK